MLTRIPWLRQGCRGGTSESVVYIDAVGWTGSFTHGAHSAARFLARLETAALDEL